MDLASVNSSGLLHAAVAREAKYTYQNYLTYKTGTYTGMWMSGEPHGRWVRERVWQHYLFISLSDTFLTVKGNEMVIISEVLTPQLTVFHRLAEAWSHSVISNTYSVWNTEFQTKWLRAEYRENLRFAFCIAHSSSYLKNDVFSTNGVCIF